jgi:hypothetical protein
MRSFVSNHRNRVITFPIFPPIDYPKLARSNYVLNGSKLFLHVLLAYWKSLLSAEGSFKDYAENKCTPK